MEEISTYIANNYKWLFSGLGVIVLGWFIKRKVSSNNKVTQKNINAGGDVVGRDKTNK